MELSKEYQWINNIGVLPKIVSESLKYLGLKEQTGLKNNNPIIMNMAKSLGLDNNIYPNDETAWCALFMSFICKTVGKPSFNFEGYDFLRASSFIKWGKHVDIKDIVFGDIVVLHRPGGGHVFTAIAKSKNKSLIHGLGGNQGNSVSFSTFESSRIVAARRYYSTNTLPESAKEYIMEDSGIISLNEK